MQRRIRSTPAELVRVYAHETCARLREAAALLAAPEEPIGLLLAGPAPAPLDLAAWRRDTRALCAAAEIDRYREPGLECLREMTELDPAAWPRPIDLLELALACSRLLSERAALGEDLLALGALAPARAAFAELLETARSPRWVERGLLGLAAWSALQREPAWSAALCSQAAGLRGATRVGRLRGLGLALWLGDDGLARQLAAGIEALPWRGLSRLEVGWLARLSRAVSAAGYPAGLVGAGLDAPEPPPRELPAALGGPAGARVPHPTAPRDRARLGPGRLLQGPQLVMLRRALRGPGDAAPGAGVQASERALLRRAKLPPPLRQAPGCTGAPAEQPPQAPAVLAWVRARRHAPDRIGALCRALLPG